MKNFLNALYYGEINPSEQVLDNFTDSEDWNRQQHMLMQREKQFLESLSEAGRLELEQLLEQHAALSGYHMEQAFRKGVNTGVQFLLEALYQ